MDLVIALAVFAAAFRALRWLELPWAWRLGSAAVLAILVHPLLVHLWLISLDAIVMTPVCFPLLIPVLIVAAGIIGYLIGLNGWMGGILTRRRF